MRDKSVEVKRCSKCGEAKSIDLFSKHPKGTLKRHSYCKQCQSEYTKKWALDNKDRRAKTTKEWQLKNKGRVRKQSLKWQRENKDKRAAIDRKYHLKETYGITPEQYDALFFMQGRMCKICGSEPNGKRLHVDHDHITDVVRGLLCSKCNTAIGLLNDSPDLMRKAAEYLENHS